MRLLALCLAIAWIWNDSGSWFGWFDDRGGYEILVPSDDYISVVPGGELIFIETCQPGVLNGDHYVIHGDSLRVWQEITPLDPARHSTWGLIKSRYR